MSNYNDTLNLYKQLQQNGAEHVDATLATPTVVGTTVEALDEAVYGSYDGEGDNSQSDLLMETMKEIENGNLSEENKKRIENNVKNSKIPSAILQDMLNNPLINTKVGEDDVDEFMKKVVKSGVGLQKSSKIIEKLEKDDEKQAQKKMQQSQSLNIGTVDYDRISQIVENIVDGRISQIEKKIIPLNENKQNPFSNIKVLQLKENGSFLMLDTDDNIYECTLKYKGKNKRKK